jgi:hypothetical protein
LQGEFLGQNAIKLNRHFALDICLVAQFHGVGSDSVPTDGVCPACGSTTGVRAAVATIEMTEKKV